VSEYSKKTGENAKKIFLKKSIFRFEFKVYFHLHLSDIQKVDLLDLDPATPYTGKFFLFFFILLSFLYFYRFYTFIFPSSFILFFSSENKKNKFPTYT